MKLHVAPPCSLESPYSMLVASWPWPWGQLVVRVRTCTVQLYAHAHACARAYTAVPVPVPVSPCTLFHFLIPRTARRPRRRAACKAL